jgi:hypothetical protein
VRSHYGLLLLVHSDGPEDLSVHEASILEVPQSSRKLALILLVKDDLANVSIVVDFKDDSHSFLSARYYSADNNDLGR